MSNIVKSKFAHLLRGLLRRFEDKEVEVRAVETPRANVVISPTIKPVSAKSAETAPSPRIPMPSVPAENTNELKLPLQIVFNSLPMELRAKIVQTPSPNAMMTISVEKILAQLALGSVKISFRELRLAAPTMFATNAGEFDSRPVTLPLNEILARLNPILLTRRATQKQVEVADDVAGPFGHNGQGVTFTTASPKPATPPLSLPQRPQMGSSAPIPMPSAPAMRIVKPAAPMAHNNNTISNNGNGSHAHTSPAFPEKAAPLPAPSFNAAPQIPVTTAESTVLVPLSALMNGWPDGVKLEISRSNATNAQIALPVNLVEPALKRGRVTFYWKSLRGLIRPTPLPVSIFDSTELELPLKVIAPLFFARQNTGQKSQQKIQVSEEIPNLFFGFPKAQPPDAAPETVNAEGQSTVFKAADVKTLDTNFFPHGQNNEASKIEGAEFKRPIAPATDFSSRCVTPQEVIARVMELPGVAGAVITLLDGLKVASQVPSEMNADAIAAFLPQVFARVGQSTRELRVGPLNNLNFTLGRVQWKIFRVSGIYFAAFGHSGKQLPTAQLVLLVNQLERKQQS